MRAWHWVLIAAVCCACDDGGGGDGAGGAGGMIVIDAGAGGMGGVGGMGGAVDEDAGLEMPDAAPPDMAVECAPGTAYVPGTPLFVERTAEWGLDSIGVQGTLMSVGDINDDGYADLIVRRGGVRADVLEPGEERRHTWVLTNTGQGRFTDTTVESGFLAVRGDYPIAVGRPNWTVAFGDVDNDGDLDVYSGIDVRNPVTLEREAGDVVVRETSELLLNDGTGRFELTFPNDPVRRAGTEDIPSGAVFVDYDRDGHLDLFQSQGGLGAPNQDRLFHGGPDGELTDVTAAVGLSTLSWDSIQLADLNAGRGRTTAWSAQACDLNDDGAPELFVGSYGRAPNHLWQNDGDGFTNRSVASGYAFDENLEWGDNQFARCYCQQNRGAPDCANVPAPNIGCNQQNWRHQFDRQPFRNGGNSGATLCVDLNNDGNLDLFTSEIRHWWAGQASDWSEVLVNSGEPDVRFDRPGRDTMGLTIEHPAGNWDEGHITAGTVDVDNDGRQELYIGATDYPGNRGRLYHNQSTAEGGLMFQEIPPEDGFLHWRSHGFATADFDRDGDLDVMVGHSRARCGDVGECYPSQQVRFFENVSADGGESNWIQLDLRGGAGTNRLAIGARVEVRAGGLLQVKEVSGGYGHFGAQDDRVLHFGLGPACVAEITIRWPNAELTEQTVTVTGGARYRIEQGGAPQAL